MRKYIRLLAILFALPLYLNAQNDDNGPDICNLIQEYNKKVIYTDVKTFRGLGVTLATFKREPKVVLYKYQKPCTLK